MKKIIQLFFTMLLLVKATTIFAQTPLHTFDLNGSYNNTSGTVAMTEIGTGSISNSNDRNNTPNEALQFNPRLRIRDFKFIIIVFRVVPKSIKPFSSFFV